MLTEQETFDTVVAHLRKQGKQALNGTACVYRASDGCKCAVGCLISDKDYDRSMEGTNFNGFQNRNLKTDGMKRMIEKYGHQYELLGRLQNCHDHVEVSKWETYWKKLAQDRELIYTPPAPIEQPVEV